MMIDLYGLEQNDYTKKFLANADLILDLFFRFGNKVATNNLIGMPPEVKRSLFEAVIYATNDEARTLYLRNKVDKTTKFADLDVYISNEELMKQMLELKELLQILVAQTQSETL